MSRRSPSVGLRLERLSWSPKRLARLGYLVGAGRSSAEIALDPLVRTTPANVRAHVRRFGLAFREPETPRLPAPILTRYAEAAAQRGISRDQLFYRLLLQAGSDDALIDNILDDRD